MKLYRSLTTNKIYAYEEDGSQDHLISPNYVRVSQEEADAEALAVKESIESSLRGLNTV